MIRARKLTKKFGSRTAISALDFDLDDRACLVLTGPNGAGKTTLLRLCAGLISPTAGELDIAVPRGAIGFLGHEALVYRELSPLENLELFGRLYRVEERRERIGMLLERFGLWEVRHDRVETFSRGMSQRLALCRALLHDPRLLLLDEPYSGLDEQAAELLDRELEAIVADRTVLLATHAPQRVAGFATATLSLARARYASGLAG